LRKSKEERELGACCLEGFVGVEMTALLLAAGRSVWLLGCWLKEREVAA